MTDSRHGAVAIIDDDGAVRDSLRFLLELTNHRVSVYISAAAFLQDSTARPACIIVDQHMPEMTGLELVSQMRSRQNRTPILLMTGAPSSLIIARAAQVGIEKVLEKPPNEADLLSFVDAHK